jgi:hypothetical protein
MVVTVGDVLERTGEGIGAVQSAPGLVRLCCALTSYRQLNTPGVPHLGIRLSCVRSLCHRAASPTEEDRCDSGEGAS